MPPSVDHIRSVTEAYLGRHPNERAALSILFKALAAVDDPTHRKTFPAHVTCSAIVIDTDRRVLHIVHKATGKLLAPGGHNEQDDQDLRAGALRELHEEAGIPANAVVALPGYQDVPLDINVHVIEANLSKDEPNHHHVDFRWGFVLPARHAVKLQIEEVDGYEWLPFTSATSLTVRSKLALLP